MEAILDFMGDLDPMLAALIATLFTWLMTAAGASLVFLFKEMKRVWLDGMLGFTGGVMIAAKINTTTKACFLYFLKNSGVIKPILVKK